MKAIPVWLMAFILTLQSSMQPYRGTRTHTHTHFIFTRTMMEHTAVILPVLLTKFYKSLIMNTKCSSVPPPFLLVVHFFIWLHETHARQTMVHIYRIWLTKDDSTCINHSIQVCNKYTGIGTTWVNLINQLHSIFTNQMTVCKYEGRCCVYCERISELRKITVHTEY